MAIYRRGSVGDEVRRIQGRLEELGHYRGPIDGIYGGGTEVAVRAFQEEADDLSVDGLVGPDTWDVLFGGEEAPEPAIAARSLGRRTLALTGSFETGAPIPDCFAGLSGDFDGQGISFGALQWNLGQGSLQPLLRTMLEEHDDTMRRIFGDRVRVLESVLDAERDEQLSWARSIQDRNRHVLFEPWRGQFRTLGRTEAFQELQVQAAARLHQEALELCTEYGLRSERGVALMFDIKVQNGSIPRLVGEEIRRAFDRLEERGPEEERQGEADGGQGEADPESRLEVERMKIVANRRAEASNPRWVEDVRRRKLTIAEGRGTVHGRHFDLADQYGLGLKPVPELGGEDAGSS